MPQAAIAPTLAPNVAAVLGPHCTAAILHIRSPDMPHGLTYALFPTLTPGRKPWGYPSLQALARRIHRDRAGDALQLHQEKVSFRDHVREVTAVYAEDPTSQRVRFLGYAWTGDRPREALEAALRQLQPVASVEG